MKKKSIRRIGVFTSGGDSPGMNACIRAVVRTALYHKKEVIGIMHGYSGMVSGEMIELNSRSVSNIIHRGGTILKTSRSEEFRTKQGRAKAFANLEKFEIDGVVAIGGDGTYRGALQFMKEYPVTFVGVPGTIDNDLYGTDYTLGFDTAINTVIQAVDKIRDTAASHDRLFFIEVMGRDSGCIALWSGIAGGAEDILLPERKTNINELVDTLEKCVKNEKSSTIILVAEGDDAGGALEIAEKVKKKFNVYDTRVSILGHIQRGGSPTCFDRLLGTRFGVEATEALLKGISGKTIGWTDNKISWIPFSKATKQKEPLDKSLLRYKKILNI